MAEAHDKLIGSTLSHFRIEAKLGEGGMGRVYKAMDVRLRRPVAIKMLSSALSHDQQALRRLEFEAVAASSINHPNICTIYEIITYRRQSFIVMEYIEGSTLREVLQNKGSLSPLQALVWFEQICHAISLAHQKGIVHLDLKPDNIMIDAATNAVKITDFGLARLATHSLEQDFPLEPEKTGCSIENSQRFAQTLTGIMGTAAYMAPEQILRTELDHRADIFVLGILLYELVTGHNPFLADDHLKTLQNIQNVNATIVEVTALPSHFASIISSCLQAAPDARYNDMTGLLADVQKAKRRHRGTSRLLFWQSLKKRSQRKKLKVLIAISAILLLTLTLLTFDKWKPLAGSIHNKADIDLTTTSLKAYQLFKQGQQDYWRYANRDAIEKLQAAVSIDSSFAYAHSLLGMLLYWQDRNEEAKKCFQIAARHFDNLSGAERLFVEGMLYYDVNDNPNMLNTFSTMTERYSTHIDGLLAAALACEKLKDYEGAMKFTQRVIDINSTHIAAHGNMADMLEWQGRYEEALIFSKKQYDLILESGDNRGLEAAAEMVGRMHHWLNHPQLAIDYLKESIALDPNNRDAAILLAEVYALQGRNDQAENILRKAITRPMKKQALAKLFIILARLYAFQGRYVDALEACNKAATSDANFTFASAHEKGRIYIELQQPDLIMQEIKKLTSAYPADVLAESTQFLWLNFHYHLLLGHVAAGRQWYKKFTSVAGEQKAAGWEIDLRIASGEFEYASELLSQRIAADPAYAMGDRIGDCTRLASLYLAERDFDKAMAACEQALKARHILGGMHRATSYSRLIAILSHIFESMGRFDESLRFCDRFFTFWPNADPNIPLLLEMQQRRARLQELETGKDLDISRADPAVD